jgi:hypothetical protein
MPPCRLPARWRENVKDCVNCNDDRRLTSGDDGYRPLTVEWSAVKALAVDNCKRSRSRHSNTATKHYTFSALFYRPNRSLFIKTKRRTAEYRSRRVGDGRLL